MQLQGKKKNNQPCSKLKSLYLSCRAHFPCSSSSTSMKYLPINPVPLSKIPPVASQHNKRVSQKSRSSLREHQNDEAEVHWRRVSELEKQLLELEELLHTELERLRSHLVTNKNNDDKNHDINFDGEKGKLGRLDGNGGYLYSSLDNKVLQDGICQDLAIQFSSPALVPPEDGSSISEVLDQMAMMGRENLITWLLESIPMTDISDKPQGRIVTPCNNPQNIMEAILLNAIPKLGELVIEGLQIQMGVREVVKRQQEEIRNWRREKNIEASRIDDGSHAGGCGGGDVLMMAMLIQPRDPHKGYKTVNEMMIGFVEAANYDEEEEEQGGFLIKAVHVAGMMARRRNGKAIHNSLWCLSLPN